MFSVAMNYDTGSFRDRDGRIFRDGSGRILRALSSHALEEWECLGRTNFFPQAMAQGRVVETFQIDINELPELPAAEERWSGVLEHQPIPCVSYPYEWTFGMLRDAALLQLELLQAALHENFTIKDGTAYNVQWIGTRPVFIDIPSFERLPPGQAWTGYRQFCQTCLFPLLLQAYKGVPFHPWLRGRIDGILPEECWRLMSWRDLLRGGVTSHVALHAWLQSSQAIDRGDPARSLGKAGFHKELIERNATGLARVVRNLRWEPATSNWSEYAEANSYSPHDHQAKLEFVRAALDAHSPQRVWDLGCNTGEYSRLAAEHAELVLALDADHLAIERLYQGLKQSGGRAAERILPMVGSAVDLPGGLGWRNAERLPLLERWHPNLVMCLALLHHLVLGHGVPLPELVDWFARLQVLLIVEFVDKDDPMARRLLRGRRDNDTGYTRQHFEQLLLERFEIARRQSLTSGTRTLYFAVPKES